MARKLIVEIVGDASSLERSFKRAQNSTNRFNREMTTSGRTAVTVTGAYRGLSGAGLLAGGAVAAAGLALKNSISIASNFNEQISKTNVVFGESAAGIEEWSKTSATALGLAQDQALAVASSFGALFKPLNIIGDKAAEQSKALTQLGADLASFYNTDVQDALDAIRSGLVGESEPLRRYGVLLSETRVQQEALNETHKESAKQLTQQEKVLARIALIYKDTGQAQGDFERTSGGLANQSRILQANIRDLERELGEGLIPGLTKAVEATNALIVAFKKIPGIGVSGADVFEKIGDDIGRIAKGTPVVRGLVSAFSDNKPDPGWTSVFTAIERIGHLGRIASLDQIEALRGHRDLNRRVLPNIPSKIRGATFGNVGAPPTLAQIRAQALATFGGTGSPAEIRAVQAQIDFQTREVARLTKRINSGRGPIRDFFDQRNAAIEDIRAQQDRLASIAADKAAKIKASAKKARDALSDALNESFGGSVLAPGAFGRAQAGFRAPLVRGRGRVSDSILAAAQFQALGLTATGEELAPTRKALQDQLAKIKAGLKGTILDTQPNRNLLEGARKVLGGKFGQLTDEVSRRMKELFDALDPDKSESGRRFVSAVTGRKLSQTLGARLGLTPEQIRQLRLNITGAHFTSGSLAGAAGFSPTIQTRIDIDGRQVAISTHRYSAKARRQTATQTRGRVLP